MTLEESIIYLDKQAADFTPEERARNGATLLDSEIPGWYNRINLKTFRILSPNHCIIGQLYQNEDTDGVFGPFTRGLKDLGAYDERVAYGFAMATSDEDGESKQLDAAWRTEILNRRTT
jgi:hypothetical protein